MPLDDFHGPTFVAFTDIAGFKQLMRTRNRAMDALHHFYLHGYNILRSQAKDAADRVDGLFISDCAVLFVRPKHHDPQAELRAMLSIVQSLNREMLQHDLMLSTSIAYGDFDYTPRDEFIGIEKNLIIGRPYLEAYLDQSSGSPKLDPGQCRILREHIPPTIFPLPETDDYFSRVRPVQKYSYFYWMCRNAQEIEAFERQYLDSYNLKYAGMLNALKRNI